MANPVKEIYLLGIEASSLTSAVCISKEDQLLGAISLNLKLFCLPDPVHLLV